MFTITSGFVLSNVAGVACLRGWALAIVDVAGCSYAVMKHRANEAMD